MLKVYVAARYGRKEEARKISTALESYGFHVVSTWTKEEYPPSITLDELNPETLREIANKDIEEIRSCDALVLLSDGQKTGVPRGGKHVEFGIAMALRKKIYVLGEAENIFQYTESASVVQDFDILLARLFDCKLEEKEVIVIDPVTGGRKGQKLERFDLIAPEPLVELARVYGYGASKYADDNWMKGYSWRLSIGALLRHIMKFVGGTYTDEESGRPHLAHAMWHCITLMEFYRLKLGTDDRFSTLYEHTDGG
jgi:nucleoside 2-deoxyribosyltransferase